MSSILLLLGLQSLGYKKLLTNLQDQGSSQLISSINLIHYHPQGFKDYFFVYDYLPIYTSRTHSTTLTVYVLNTAQRYFLQEIEQLCSFLLIKTQSFSRQFVLLSGASSSLQSIVFMEGRFKIRPMLSFSPARPKEGLLRLRARLASKTANSPFLSSAQENIEGRRGLSYSPRRIKCGSAGLFKRAHAVGFKETYLLNQKTNANSKTNQPSSPLASWGSRKTQALRKNQPYSAGLRNHSNSLEKQSRQPLSKRISIIVREREGAIPTNQQLITTLSRIILGGERSNEVCLEFFQESSIYGDEQNFIQMDSQLLEDCLSHHPHGYIEV